MQIEVDWYKETGKWYTGGLVEIGNYKLYEPEFMQSIVDNQMSLVDGWQNHRFIVVTRDLDTLLPDPEFQGFHCHLFTPERFQGMVKNG